MIGTIGRGVLGLTVHCARCHDHKFDPDLAERLLPDAGVAVRVCRGRLSARARRSRPRRTRQKTAEIDARIAPLQAADSRRSKSRTAIELLPEKYKKFPANVQHAIATPGRQAHARPGAAGGAGDPHHHRFRAPRSTASCPPRTWREKKLPRRADRAVEKERPEAASRWPWRCTDGDYRFTPDGPGDEPAPGKGSEARGHRRQLSSTRVRAAISRRLPTS